jgi:hypothetical protein
VKLRDALERLLWTFVAGFLGALLGSPLLVNVIEATTDVDLDLSLVTMALVSATIAGLVAVANAVLIIARWRLSVLPNPGEGLPGLPVELPPPAPPAAP